MQATIRLMLAGATILSIGASVPAPARAQTDQLIERCGNKSGAVTPDQRVESCTGLIDGGKVFGKGGSWALTNRCAAYNDSGQHDRAIADCNKAIAGDPTAQTYANRGNAFYAKGEDDYAVDDYNQAIKLDVRDAAAFNNRARIFYSRGDYDRAIADYDRAIALGPRNARLYLSRAVVNLYRGAPSNAASDLNQAGNLDPRDIYVALWLEIVGKRNHAPTQLAKLTTFLDMTKWPAPIVQLYLGKTKPAALLAAAAAIDPAGKDGPTCEAHFYGGEFALMQSKGKKDEATRLLAQAVGECPKSFLEYGAANAELKALRAAQ